VSFYNTQKRDKMSNIKKPKGGRARKPKIDPDVEDLDLQDEPLEPGRPLTAKQAAFIDAYTVGHTAGNSTKSAEIAGYSKKTCAQIGSDILKLPHINAAIEARLREAVGTALTVQAVAVIRRIINDEEAPLKLRGAMAVKVVEFTGMGERVKVEKAKETGLDGSKNLAEMSRAELERIVHQGAAILRAAAALPPAGPMLEGQVLPHKAQDNAQLAHAEDGQATASQS